ncbi:hypothetical protein EV715DRAFT_249853, partial [Schizophyllum commune]
MTPPIPEVLGLTLRDRLHINVERPHIPVDRPTENGQPNGNTRMDGELPPATPPEEGEDRYIRKLKIYAKNLPYSIEPESKMMEILDFILLRLTQCVEAKDYDVGLVQWDSLLSYWMMLKYPIPKEKRIRLAKLYYHLCTVPGMSTTNIALCADAFKALTRSKKKLSIEDMRLPWKPVYDLLSKDLFLARRQFEYTQLSWCMGYLASHARRFYHPAAIEEMLNTFVPLINNTSLNSVLWSQYALLTFLPESHPQAYLPMLFRHWQSVNSYLYDERMLDFISRLTVLHVDPTVSDPRKITDVPDDALSEGEGRPKWAHEEPEDNFVWSGIYKDVGIFTEQQWSWVMCKTLVSMEIPLADAGSLTTGPQADNQAAFEIDRLPKAAWRIPSLARILVYSMAPDSMPSPASNAPTPMFTPTPSGMNTPMVQSSSLKEFLAAPLGRGHSVSRGRTYLAGSKALDSLVTLIASVESFFHPTNAGAWTVDLSAFVKYIAYEFNKRWHEEHQPDCKTPTNRRLTRTMKRELVKSIRTVALLAMFSHDPKVVVNIQSCLKSMSVMEPDLILHPIFDRAVPSLEAVVETQRTISIIKALGAIAPAIVCRDVYYPGAKFLVPLLQLLIPGIDLNDPSKTLCTTGFLMEIAQYIKIADLTAGEPKATDDTVPAMPSNAYANLALPAFTSDMGIADITSRLSDEEEDELLKASTQDFADWIANLVRRVIQLLENLPEEGANGTAGGELEVQVVDAVAGAFSQICVHLSEPLFDMVLGMVYDYASQNVRSNAVRAVHQLVECVANADPEKTIKRFLPLCERNIRMELDNGAGSLRTTNSSRPLPSDATLHWNLAMLRGTVYNDGSVIVKHRDALLDIVKLLSSRCYSKRAYSWTGKFLTSMLITLSHTYPLENKFVNPDEWNSEEFNKDHYKHWGKMYTSEDVSVSWHVPNEQEIDFVLQIFRELVEPTLATLEGLLQPGVVRDAIWRNDFCRHLSLVRSAFSGTPTLLQEFLTEEEALNEKLDTDILNEIPEMIANIAPCTAGFCLTDPADPRYQHVVSLKRRFGSLLHHASTSLRQQGEENTVDAVLILVRSIRSYMLEYGDSRDSFYVNEDQYASEQNVARQYANQKVWPRAVFVRRARYYHSARLRWNSIERARRHTENALIDDLVEWSLWHYPIIRQAAQGVLDAVNGTYDGVRKRALPVLFKALEPGTDDDRMKGALWTLNMSAFGKYAVGEPTLCADFWNAIFRSQWNEKPSIQEAVSVVADNALNSFVEPCYLVYDVPTPEVDEAVKDIKAILDNMPKDAALTIRCKENRMRRVDLQERSAERITNMVLEIGHADKTHWRYLIVAMRVLRTLVRRDVPLTKAQIAFFLEKCHDEHPTVYAQRAVMKGLRNIKLRTLCKSSADLVQYRPRNPLKEDVKIQQLPIVKRQLLDAYRDKRVDLTKGSDQPLLLDQDPFWLAWHDHITMTHVPDVVKSTYQPWEAASQEAVKAVREMATTKQFWQDLVTYYGEENHESTVVQDNIATVKSIFQLLEDEPFPIVKPILADLLSKKDKNKQRAGAELLAGVIGGSKNWPGEKQKILWDWLTPQVPSLLGGNVQTDTIMVWTTFLEYIFYKKDPRRLQPFVDFLMKEFKMVDFHAEMSLDALKVLSMFRALYEELNWKFSPWTNEVLNRCWAEIHSEHDDIRAYFGEIVAFSGKIKLSARPSIPSVEVFVKECRRVPEEFDIMGTRGVYHKKKVVELVQKFAVWRQERQPGVRAFQSTYDRVGITVCKWLFQSVHDTNAASVFDYILPLMPELFRFTEVPDNDELAQRANLLLVRMCGVTPPASLVNPILDAIFDAIQNSPVCMQNQ